MGVGVRGWTKIQAKIAGVGGWVRNIYDQPETYGEEGGVEAVVQGEEEKVEKMINLIKRGPPVSRVEDVKSFWEIAKEIFAEFEIRK